jgi:hypothetical protein
MPLDQPSAGGPPQAHFQNVGDSIVVGIVNVDDYHQKDYDTDELKYWADGGKVMGKRVTGLVVSLTGTTCAGGVKSGLIDVSEGDLVTFYCEGGKWYTYRDALREAGQVDVGWVMQWTRVDDKPPKNQKHNPQKVYEAQIRRPDPSKDGDLVARCQAAHDEMTRASALDAAPAEEPFPATASTGPGF